MPRGGKRQGAGAKPKWKNGKTKVIRLPVNLADEILAIARELDQIGYFESVTNSKVIDLSGISIKTVQGKSVVFLESLVLSGYEIRPMILADKIIQELYKSQLKS
jgi:hypothetical protein